MFDQWLSHLTLKMNNFSYQIEVCETKPKHSTKKRAIHCGKLLLALMLMLGKGVLVIPFLWHFVWPKLAHKLTLVNNESTVSV